MIAECRSRIRSTIGESPVRLRTANPTVPPRSVGNVSTFVPLRRIRCKRRRMSASSSGAAPVTSMYSVLRLNQCAIRVAG